jgi:predicted Zn-dependent protease
VEPLIPFVYRLLSRGKKLIEFGRRSEAKTALLRLLGFGDVPAAQREEAHWLLADLHLDAHRFRAARRHLVAALALTPNSAEGHYRLAKAIELDPDIRPMRAWKLLRRAVRLNPEQGRYWSALAMTSLRVGKPAVARKAIRRGTELEPRELSVVSELVEGLVALECPDEARELLVAARFRFRRDRGFEKLWDRFRFGQMVRDQQARRRAFALAGDEPSVLPFAIEERETPPSESREGGEAEILRHDRFSKRHVHLPRLLAMRPGPLHAP